MAKGRVERLRARSAPTPEPARSPKPDGFHETRKVYNRERAAATRQMVGAAANRQGQGQLAGAGAGATGRVESAPGEGAGCGLGGDAAPVMSADCCVRRRAEQASRKGHEAKGRAQCSSCRDGRGSGWNRPTCRGRIPISAKCGCLCRSTRGVLGGAR